MESLKTEHNGRTPNNKRKHRDVKGFVPHTELNNQNSNGSINKPHLSKGANYHGNLYTYTMQTTKEYRNKQPIH